MFLGFVYGMITYILYIELHLLKKILKKLEELSLFIQMQGATLSLHAAVVNALAMFAFAIIGPNASSTITDEIPHGYAEAYFYLAVGLCAISLVSFTGSYFENHVMQRISAFLGALALLAAVGLAILNELLSALILSRLATEETDPMTLYESRFACF